jgi:hypothetical protein
MHAACQKRLGLPFHLSCSQSCRPALTSPRPLLFAWKDLDRRLVTHTGRLKHQSQDASTGQSRRYQFIALRTVLSSVRTAQLYICQSEPQTRKGQLREAAYTACSPTIPHSVPHPPSAHAANASALLLLACLSMCLRPCDASEQSRISHHSNTLRCGLVHTAKAAGTDQRLRKSRLQPIANQSAAPAGSRPSWEGGAS